MVISSHLRPLLFFPNFLGLLTCVSTAVAGFTDVTSQVGLLPQLKKSWGNPIWGDINNDGYLDFIVPTHGLAKSGGPMVYLNNRGTSFTDIRATCGIGRGPALDDSDWHGYAFGDYDGDGNLDVYITEGAKGNKGGTLKRDLLFRGNGNGTFTYVSVSTGMQTSMSRGRSAFWVDYDNDGKLDLFVKNFGDVNVLYKNNGGGTFTEVPGAAGLAAAASGRNIGSIVAFADYDNDGLMDVAMSGDGDVQALYRNLGGGNFADVTAAAGIPVVPNGKGLAWGDYNNDGYPDLFVAKMHQGKVASGGSLYRNNGNGTFSDATSSAGLKTTANCSAALWGDYDNDGYLDLFLTNAGDTGVGPGNANFLFHNNGDGTFTNLAGTEGVTLQDNVSLHKGAAWGDYDNDGFLDLLIKDGVGSEADTGAGANGLHRLLRNAGNRNHYLKIKLSGVTSNLRGIGARVAVTANGLTSYRQNTGGGGGEYASQGSQPLHVGLGTASQASVTVTWPTGSVQTLSSVPADSTITVTEGATSLLTP